MFVLKILKVIVIGIVEGITEWLPISSTGHMILLDEIIHIDLSPEFLEMFFVVIQLGAILAVPILFWQRLNPFVGSKTERSQRLLLWAKVLVGAIPAAVFGLLLDDILDKYLYNYTVVATSLIIYGIIFIIIEKSRAERKFAVESVDAISFCDALKIGALQTLSLIPGTSRSGSTIIGGMLCNVSREASAEFSFYMAIPIILGASGLKTVKFILEGFEANYPEMLCLFVGIAVSFAVSLLVIRFLMDFVKKHDFRAFGVYRIILGTLVLIYFCLRLG